MAAPSLAPMHAPPRDPALAGPRGRNAERVLFQLAAGAWNSHWLARTARLFAWVLTGYTSIPYLFVSTKSQVLGAALIWENLVTLSWLAGIASLVVAAPVASSTPSAMARLRGVSDDALSRVEWAAACSVPFKVLAPAGLIISVLATTHADSWGQAFQGVLMVLAVAGYLLITAGMLGLMAVWARRLSPTRGRTLLTLVILIPMLLEHAQVMKSVPAVLNELLHTFLSVGATP